LYIGASLSGNVHSCLLCILFHQLFVWDEFLDKVVPLSIWQTGERNLLFCNQRDISRINLAMSVILSGYLYFPLKNIKNLRLFDFGPRYSTNHCQMQWPVFKELQLKTTPQNWSTCIDKLGTSIIVWLQAFQACFKKEYNVIYQDRPYPKIVLNGV
jgi:hypothetical protein